LRVITLFLVLLMFAFNAESEEQDINFIPESGEVNCYGTEVKLPEKFVRVDRLHITHTWNRGCTYSSEADEDSKSASFVYIENDLSTKQFKSRFNANEAKAIAKYHVLDSLSWTYQYGGMPDYFEEKIGEMIFLCYKDNNKDEGTTYSIKQCFSFIKGVLVQIGYTHSSAGKVTITSLEESISSVYR
jgi:hypothetical protein